MIDENTVWFSLFKGNVPSPVKVFEECDWVLESGVTLTACIIGKSHRICFTSGWDCLTEFIAYSLDSFSFESVEQRFLKLGDVLDREFIHRSLYYKVKVEVVGQVYLSFDEFLKTIPDIESYETMFREFKNPLSNSDSQPFTGIVIVPNKNQVFTVHTYPEVNYSIISAVEINVLEPEFAS
jgi:hypothetical protein